jgi:serine/threonine protein kinase
LLLARQVTHKNIIRIHDLGDIGGVKYITMPFIEGADLATILKAHKKLPVSRAMPIARGMVSGLASAHRAGVIHRDLKPANVMIGSDGEPTIMDFASLVPPAVQDWVRYRRRLRACGLPNRVGQRQRPPEVRWPAPSSARCRTWRQSRQEAKSSISARTSTRSA